LAPDTNLAALAASIVEGCKYLHNSRAEEVEQLLIKLKRSIISSNKSSTGGGLLQLMTKSSLETKIEAESRILLRRN
jgi:hypothetical protein